MSRKLVTVRKIDSIDSIPNADAIEVATVGGWKVVVKKNEFKVGELVIYFEIDSFLPTGNPAWQFLVDKQGREFEGVYGHRLRTVKLRGQVSQGFIIQLGGWVIDLFTTSKHDEGQELSEFFFEGADLTELLGIKKWEQPLPAQLAGQAEGLFPSFIRKTDQERCQNMVPEIFMVEDSTEPFDTTKLDVAAVEAMKEKGILSFVDNGWVRTVKAKAQRNRGYEVTMKMDGSSMTVFARRQPPEVIQEGEAAGIESGVCSRNLWLKVNEANKDNSFVRMAVDSGLLLALEGLAAEGIELAVQGELMGPSIQGNREELRNFQFFVFDIQLMSEGRYATVFERYSLMDKLRERGVNPSLVQHVPIMVEPGVFKNFWDLSGEERIQFTLEHLGIKDVQQLLKFAEGPSLVNPIREGLVFKDMGGQFSFKAISNLYLLKGGD